MRSANNAKRTADIRASNKISREPRWAANGSDARRRPEAVSDKMIQQGPTTPQMGYLRPNPSGRGAFRPHTASLLLAVLYFNTRIVEAPCLGPKFSASRPRLILLEALRRPLSLSAPRQKSRIKIDALRMQPTRTHWANIPDNLFFQGSEIISDPRPRTTGLHCPGSRTKV